MLIAVIWSRFGPYHLARLRGAAEVAASRDDTIIGIEIARRDTVYDWSNIAGVGALEHITLFDREVYEDIPASVIRRRIAATLTNLAPDAVAINGWAAPEARAALRWCDGGRRAEAIVMSETKADDAPREWWKEAYKRHLLQGCGAALVGGTAQAEYLTGLGVPRAGIHLGYDVVDNNYFASSAAAVRRDAIRERAHLGLPERYFFACTRFIGRKNVDGLLLAYAMYRRRAGSRPWDLVIAGSGEAKAAYEQLVRAKSIDGVTWPGFVQYPDLPAYYGLASAFIHAAHTEAWGLVVNEALASGLPVLVSRTVGAARELIEEGRNGLTFDPANTEDLADKMRHLAVLDAPRLAGMRAAASRSVELWSPRRFGEGLMAAVYGPIRHRSHIDSRGALRAQTRATDTETVRNT